MIRKKRFKKCKTRTVLQTLIFSRKQFTSGDAKSWLKWHRFKSDLDRKPQTYRARQVSPKKFEKGSFRTIRFKKGLLGVIGCPR